MKDPMAQALEDLARFAKTADSNLTLVEEVKKVQALYQSQRSAIAVVADERRLADSSLATVCKLLNIKPGELVP